MTLQTINVGAIGNDGTGDQARVAFTKIQTMLAELYTLASALPIGGTAGQYLGKSSSANNDTAWYGPPLTATSSTTVSVDTSTPNQVKFNVITSIPSALWAARSTGTTGDLKRITDIGPTGGTLFQYDGTVWRVIAPTLIVFDTTLATAAALNTSEQVVKQNTIPTGLLSAGRMLVIRILWQRDGTTDALTSTSIRIGSAGTTGDALVIAATGPLSSNRVTTTETWLIPTAVTTLRLADSLASQGFSNNSSSSATPSPANFTIADHTANPIIISANTTMAGSTNHGQVAHMFVELLP